MTLSSSKSPSVTFSSPPSTAFFVCARSASPIRSIEELAPPSPPVICSPALTRTASIHESRVSTSGALMMYTLRDAGVILKQHCLPSASFGSHVVTWQPCKAITPLSSPVVSTDVPSAPEPL
eukprot:jgi/Chrpa1/4568/Chrysochromulina_OHIO_Genome00006666-RA